MKKVFFLLFVLQCAYVMAQTVSPIPTVPMRRGKIMFVKETGGIVAQPDMAEETLRKVEVGDSVNILEISTQDYSINGVSDKWYKVKNGEIIGWVFGSTISVDRIIKPMTVNRPTKRIPADSTAVVRNYGYLVTCKNKKDQIKLSNNMFPDSGKVYVKYDFLEYFPEMGICIFQVQYEKSTDHLVIHLNTNTSTTMKGYPIISKDKKTVCAINVEDNRSTKSIIEVFSITEEGWKLLFTQAVKGLVPDYSWISEKVVRMKVMLEVPKKEKTFTMQELDIDTQKIKEEGKK
ncbi:MAG: hypothetical protein ACKVTZ_09305 [Bacteroidia bacterium]